MRLHEFSELMECVPCRDTADLLGVLLGATSPKTLRAWLMARAQTPSFTRGDLRALVYTLRDLSRTTHDAELALDCDEYRESIEQFVHEWETR
jgi:hypothetical protein